MYKNSKLTLFIVDVRYKFAFNLESFIENKKKLFGACAH